MEGGWKTPPPPPVLQRDKKSPVLIGLMQKYNSVSKDIREQIKWLWLFFTKDRDSFEDCLRENDVIPDKNEGDRLKKYLQDRPYSKLILKCYQPTGYHLLPS